MADIKEATTELRRDFLTGELVAVSPERLNRPMEPERSKCPFCRENSHMTPEAVYQSGNVRVIPNKYPALEQHSETGYGIHEVLIDTAMHGQELHNFSIDHMVEVFTAIQSRLLALAQDPNILYTQVFKNQGRGAGASQAHSHWQILGMPQLAPKQAAMQRAFKAYNTETGGCYLCDLQAAVREKRLVICDDEHIIAYSPEASAFADGVSIMPIRHVSGFAEMEAPELKALAVALKRILRGFKSLHEKSKAGTDYNLVIQEGTCPEAHLFLQMIPRLGNFAGFEIGTGCYINSIPPEVTAKNYRAALSFE